MAHTSVRGHTHEPEILKLLNELSRGDVLLVDLRGTKGSELKGMHPCVVVSNDIINRVARTLVVVPISSHDGQGVPKDYEVPLKVGDGELVKASAAIPHQVRTIDRHDDRIVEKWGRLSDDSMDQIEDMLFWAVSDGTVDDD